MTDEWIEAHNAAVAAFRATYLPRIAAMTEDECRCVYDRWTTPGMAANLIPLEFRATLGMAWPDENSVGVGIDLIQHVLEKLDRYDMDFRPRPGSSIEDEGG